MNLFDTTEKILKFNRSLNQQLQIKRVLNPFTQIFIDVHQAISLGILYNGYYRNRYGGLIPLHIAASKGLIQFLVNEQNECEEEIEIEYRTNKNSFITTLIIRQVYDQILNQMISIREAIEKNLIDTEMFLYSSSLSISLHEAFYRGLIVGEIRTTIDSNFKFEYKKQQLIINTIENEKIDFDDLVASMNALIQNLTTFTKDTIRLIDECELTSTGYIRHRQTGTCYLLTQAIELGLVTLPDISNSINHDITLISDTFIFDLLKATDDTDENKRLTRSVGRILPLVNRC